MELNDFQRFSYRSFGGLAQRRIHRYPTLGFWLQRAHLTVRPEVHLASLWMTALLAGIVGVLLSVALFALWMTGALAMPVRMLVLLPLIPVILAAGVHVTGLVLPKLTARRRARDIEARLPYALNYLSTMANSGATPERMFETLGAQDLYGEVAKEAAWLDRDIKLLGSDLMTALSRAIDRSPSARFQDLLQGIVTVLTSGGDLKLYLLSKGDQYLVEGRQENQRFIDSMGVLAESFVVVVVAAPLFLLVILSVMTMFGGDPRQVLTLGYLLVLAVLPVAQAAFGLMIRSMTPEA
jgi:flagellar protein FlaJ